MKPARSDDGLARLASHKGIISLREPHKGVISHKGTMLQSATGEELSAWIRESRCYMECKRRKQ